MKGCRRNFLRLLLTAFCLLPSVFAQVITTVAGSTWIFRGAGGAATSAPLGSVTGLAVDASGNAYAADVDNHVVVRISPSGTLTVVAGNGIRGFSGDGGSATQASLFSPTGVAVDAAGNVYIADTQNHRVRKVTSAGIITTVAGTGVSGFAGDGGPAVSARLNGPTALAVDAGGNLFIADSLNQRIRKVGSNGTISTVAGSGVKGFSGDSGPATSAALNSPRGLAVDSAGNLYIADRDNHRIRRVSAGGTITTIAGTGAQSFSGDGGPAASATLAFPYGIAVDASGALFVADTLNQRVRKVSGGTITTIAGNGSRALAGDNGPALSASLNLPQSVAVDGAGNVYIADTFNNRVRKISAAGTITTAAGNGQFKFGGDAGPAASASLNGPQGLAIDPAGFIYVADVFNHRVRKINAAGIITTVAGTGVLGFSGDGGPGASALLNSPAAVALDAAGNLYIADSGNHRVRKLSVTATISTLAGTGIPSFSGDGGPATVAALNQPAGLAVDQAGNIYVAETGNHRVRKITSTGIITTLAGNGTAGFSGDSGPAASAMLNSPNGLTLDTSGNLFIADTFNHRVRKVTSSGTISTIAGSGTQAFSGDNGAAVNASLNSPTGVALDPAGNLYIADSLNHRIRKVTAGGTITTAAGVGTAGFFGDGGPAPLAFLNQPLGVATDSSGSLYIADTLNDRIRELLLSAPSFSADPKTLTFTAPAGTPAVGAQAIVVSGLVSGLPWTAGASTQTGGAWLSVSPTGGAVPGSISVSVDLTGLAPGTYQGTVTVAASLASPPTQTVAVTLVVQQAAAAKLVVEPSSIIFEAPAGGSASASGGKTLRISNGGGGALNWTAQPETSTGGAWLAASPASGTASAAAPAAVEIAVNTAGLQAGVYTGAIRVSSSTTTEQVTVPVTLLLAQPTQTILLSQTGLLFTGVAGTATVPAQSFGILNIGQGSMSWTVEPSALSGGNWLGVSPAFGSSQADSLDIPSVDVSANPGSLGTGRYSGLVRVRAPAANNSPQLVTVDMNVLPAGSNPGVLVRPTGLIFAARAGTSSPGSQTVRLATAAAQSVGVRVGLMTFDGGNWLEALPRGLTVSPGSVSTITVQPTLGSLAPGIYRGTVTLLFGDGSPAQVVSILFVVVGSSVQSAFRNPKSAIDCTPTKLLAVNRSLGSAFSSPVGWPTNIEIQVVDDCGLAVPNATVVATFSNGDPPLTLASLRNGIYTGTWRPLTPAVQTTVTARASLPPLGPAEVIVQGGVGENPNAPTLFAGGIVNAASFEKGGALAPGSIVSVFGRKLGTTGLLASTLPLPTSLAGASLNVAGVDVPLFYSSDGQINAQLPFDLQPNTRTQAAVRVSRAGAQEAITVPETITIAPARPGIFTTNQQGTGQGAILDAQARVVDSNAPAAAGDVVAVYCTGLGTTQPAVPPGQPAPAAEPLARVTLPVTATVGGRTATVQFAGLAPGFVGLYQVNVQIPAGVTPGPAVSLVLVQNGVPSNTVTLAVR